MSDVFITHRIGKNVFLCISELSSETLGEQGIKGAALRAGGLYLYRLDDRPRVGHLTVLAKVLTLEMAFELIEVFTKLARKSKRKPPKKPNSKGLAGGKRGKGVRGQRSSKSKRLDARI